MERGFESALAKYITPCPALFCQACHMPLEQKLFCVASTLFAKERKIAQILTLVVAKHQD